MTKTWKHHLGQGIHNQRGAKAWWPGHSLRTVNTEARQEALHRRNNAEIKLRRYKQLIFWLEIARNYFSIQVQAIYRRNVWYYGRRMTVSKWLWKNWLILHVLLILKQKKAFKCYILLKFCEHLYQKPISVSKLNTKVITGATNGLPVWSTTR